jgi:hypothetical protein
MTKIMKWIFLGIACAILSILLYKTIDSDWATKTNMGILMTIAFFASATCAILCGFNAIELKEDSSSSEEALKSKRRQQIIKTIQVDRQETAVS